MDMNIASQHVASTPLRGGSGYVINTPVYEGPLDLLLRLIERAELDITAIALASVTDQYLAYMRALQDNAQADEISAFLVIAARLIQIKSEALLPRPPTREAGEEDPAEALAQQLRIYKRFKEIANLLETRQTQGLRTYLRLAPPPKVEARLDLSDITLTDLLAAAESIFAGDPEKQSLGTIISAPKVTIREKISHIVETLGKDKNVRFQTLVGVNASRLETVVTFLALLELVKRYRVAARQDKTFGEIEIERSDEWNEGEEFELEFE